MVTMRQETQGERDKSGGVWRRAAMPLPVRTARAAPAPIMVGAPAFAAQEILEQAVSLAFDIPASALRARTRGRARVAFARQVAMYLAHVAYGQSLTEVGNLFGRDRTTVAHACGVIEDRRDDPGFDRSMDRLEAALYRFMAASVMLAPAVSPAEEGLRDAR